MQREKQLKARADAQHFIPPPPKSREWKQKPHSQECHIKNPWQSWAPQQSSLVGGKAPCKAVSLEMVNVSAPRSLPPEPHAAYKEEITSWAEARALPRFLASTPPLPGKEAVLTPFQLLTQRSRHQCLGNSGCQEKRFSNLLLCRQSTSQAPLPKSTHLTGTGLPMPSSVTPETGSCF